MTQADDGWSGTNFERPAWKRLLEDVNSGKVNMIIVKDLSRMRRNAPDASIFIKKYCRVGSIWLIAVSDSVDTQVSGNEEIIDIINMYNGWYPREISKKTRNAKESRARQGMFIGSHPPYGYVKSPEDKHILILSEDAGIIHEIFRRVAGGETAREICDDFNLRGVITPSCRINGHSLEHPNRVPERATWNTGTMYSILNNMVYLGHMVNGKRKNVSYDSNKRRITLPQEHIVVPNTHEAIIPIELWNAAQTNRKGRSAPKKRGNSSELSLFAGSVRCADCGGLLALQRDKGILRCTTYNNGGSSACSGHTIRQDSLNELVLAGIQKYTALAAEDADALADDLYRMLIQEEQQDIKSRTGRISALRQKLDVIAAKVEKLYDEKFGKGMDEAVFASMLSHYEADKSMISTQLEALETDAARTRDAEERVNNWMRAIKEAVTIEALDRALLAALIEKIVVHEREKVDGKIHQRVEIYYKFVGNLAGLHEA